MQKVLDFLEKYCQWLAVGIAAVFFLLALWQYLPGISEPVSVTVDNQTYSPGSVDPAIKESADRLQNQIASTATIDPAVPTYSKTFAADVDAAAAKPLAPIASGTFLVPSYKIPSDWDVSPRQSPQDDQGSMKVAALPDLPAAVIKSDPLGPVIATGFSQVTPVNAQPGVENQAPVPQPGQPGQPAPSNAQDVTWVRVPYVIPMQRIRAAFGGVGIPPALSRTSVLAVELIRQRQMTGDAWGPEEIVAKLPTVQLRDMPPESSAIPVALDYRQWAEQNQLAIVQPPFFPVVGGEDPNVLKPPVVAPEAAIFDPTTFPPNGDLSKLTSEQRAAVLAERRRVNREMEQQRRQNRTQPQPRGRGNTNGNDIGMEFAPQEALPRGTSGAGLTRPMQYPRPGQGYPQGYPQGMPGDYDPSMGGMEGGMPAAAQPGQPIILPPLPPAPFDPAAPGTPDIEGVAYDTTAKGDATYRYRIRYYLANPIYQVANVAQDPALINQFAIAGEDKSTWSEPILITPLTHIFLAVQPSPGFGPIRFTIFRWQNGQQHRALQLFSAGDSIGKVENGIDFRTPWTLVEVRRDSSADGPYAVLMNQEGRIRRQIFTVDTASEEQKRLQAQIDAQQQAAGVGNPGTGYPGNAGYAQ